MCLIVVFEFGVYGIVDWSCINNVIEIEICYMRRICYLID